MIRKQTKIVATISDQNCGEDLLRNLYKNGMNVVRINTAHQTYEDTLKVVNSVRKVSEKIAVMVDIKGPEVRTGPLESPVTYNTGDEVKVGCDNFFDKNPAGTIQVSYPGFVKELNTGNRILIDDGDMELEVLENKTDHLVCRFVNGGTLKSNKSVNVPGVHLNLPSLTEKDIGYIRFSCEHKLDFIAHSFVRNREDVLEVQKILDEENNSSLKIIAKIENREGVENIKEILDYAYGAMVARGDLAVEIPTQEVPIVQKEIIRECILRAKPVITATQMLHSMIEHPRPTRAEVSDVANAIFDGTDAVMLSGETAYGQYPVEAVKMMSKIAREVEPNKDPSKRIRGKIIETDETQYLCRTAVKACDDFTVEGIIVHTSTGRSARVISSYRGKNSIFARCEDIKVVRELSLSYGIYPGLIPPYNSTDELMIQCVKPLVEAGEFSTDCTVITLSGLFHMSRGPVLFQINRVEDILFDAES